MAKARTKVVVEFVLTGADKDTAPDEVTIKYAAEDTATWTGAVKRNRLTETLSAGEKSTLQGFINSVILPAVNTDAGTS